MWAPPPSPPVKKNCPHLEPFIFVRHAHTTGAEGVQWQERASVGNKTEFSKLACTCPSQSRAIQLVRAKARMGEWEENFEGLHKARIISEHGLFKVINMMTAVETGQPKDHELT